MKILGDFTYTLYETLLMVSNDPYNIQKSPSEKTLFPKDTRGSLMINYTL